MNKEIVRVILGIGGDSVVLVAGGIHAAPMASAVPASKTSCTPGA